MKNVTGMRKWGWLCFMVAWIPFIGIFIGMSSLPEGSYDWGQLPLLARGSILATGVLFGLSMLLLLGTSLLGGIENAQVLKNGQPAYAKVLELRDTGTTINYNPLVHFKLEVHPPAGPAFVAETERVIPRLQIPQIQPGTEVDVKFDPNTKEVAIMSKVPSASTN